jgi:hypothetical protein
MRKLFVCLFALAVAAAAVDPESDGSFNRRLKVSGPVDLDVVNDSGLISVKAGPGGEVVVRAEMRAQRNWGSRQAALDRIRKIEAHPPVEQSGNSIRIGRFSEREATRGVNIRYEITVPHDTRIKCVTDSGGIRVEGIRGPVEAAADSGGIEISNVAERIVANADSGGIRILNAGGPVEATADSGGIRIEQAKASPIRARADSGGITVRLAPGAGYDVDAACDSGRLAIGSGIALSGETKARSARGKARGGGPLVDLRADSGGIRIE